MKRCRDNPWKGAILGMVGGVAGTLAMGLYWKAVKAARGEDSTEGVDRIVYDDQAQLLNASFADYLLPLATDFPQVRGLTLELRPSPSNPLGAKGAGEGGMVAVAATMANAVAAALKPLGVEVRDLPLSPARLWQMVNGARSSRS